MLVFTDSDSYVKWGASLANQIPKDWPVRLVYARSNAEPSPRQLAEALEGSRFEGDTATRVGVADVRGILEDWRPDVVVAAARGPAVQAMVDLIDNVPRRPVIVSGLAGIAVPVIPYGLGFRRAVDVFVLHSRRELREFAVASAQLGIPHTYELATLPFLSSAPGPVEADPMRGAVEPEPVRNRIVFAAQALVPGTRRERTWLLLQLIETARAHPHLEVVIKVRARGGEPQTHAEHFSYEDLLARIVASGEQVPDNLVVESGAMRRHLRRAVGLVTVSSTSLLEAMAEGVPCLALTDFGVGAEQINLVLTESGLLGTSRDLVAASFRHPDPDWLDDNYFHDPADNTWLPRVEAVLERRRLTGLPPCPTPPRTLINRARSRAYRHFAFASEEGSVLERVESRVLGVGLWGNRRRREIVRAIRRLGA